MSNPFYYTKTAAGTLAHLALALGWVGSFLVPWVYIYIHIQRYMCPWHSMWKWIERLTCLGWVFWLPFKMNPKNGVIVFKCRNSWDGSGTSGVPLIRKIQSIEGNMVTVALNLYTKRNIHTYIHITREAGRSLDASVCSGTSSSGCLPLLWSNVCTDVVNFRYGVWHNTIIISTTPPATSNQLQLRVWMPE